MGDEVRQVRFGTTIIEYEIERRPRRRTVTLAVDAIDDVTAKVPAGMVGTEVDQVVLSRAAWIVRQMADLDELGPRPQPHEYVSGESYAYLGRHYRLKVAEVPGLRKPVAKLRGAFLSVGLPAELAKGVRAGAVQEALVQWYRTRAVHRLPERTVIYAGRLGQEVPAVLVRDQQKRWGSCSQHGEIRFNWRIVMAPISLVDYVVAHELCHLRHPDHSQDFWKLLRAVLPDYEDRKARLRLLGSTLRV